MLTLVSSTEAVHFVLASLSCFELGLDMALRVARDSCVMSISFGGQAVSERPLALRPSLATGLPFRDVTPPEPQREGEGS